MFYSRRKKRLRISPKRSSIHFRLLFKSSQKRVWWTNCMGRWRSPETRPSLRAWPISKWTTATLKIYVECRKNSIPARIAYTLTLLCREITSYFKAVYFRQPLIRKWIWILQGGSTMPISRRLSSRKVYCKWTKMIIHLITSCKKPAQSKA